ncbi:alanine--tRNA ligase [Candidatus Pacearchaeota archaeon CG06_land_8_20_14_3_00_35_12]|nr:MAG: alanine--tRNA ligase [Candidatus Pacearchaeota archaeon CG06_land_8_20_14_3_00_35_12]
MALTRQQLIKSYLDFFKSKKHAIIENVSLVPEHDPTVLFTTAGMHPLVPFLLGQKHLLGKRLCNVQRCIRTQDIDEVGDSFHHTFFEMLGNWSLGDYFKDEAIEFSFEFLTKTLKIPIEKLAISCFAGDKDAPRDLDASKKWESLGIPKERIAFLPKNNNWWGPAGKTGPCGPDSEMFYWRSSKKAPEKFDPLDDTWVEIWNDVFMQYNKTESGFEELKQKNVDTGMGVERTTAILNKLDDDYLSDSFLPLVKKIEELSKKRYVKEETKAMRIIADHIKAAVFIVADGIFPSNVERGYVLRRLIRRAIRYGRELGLEQFISEIAESVFDIYRDYSHLAKNKDKILNELEKEETKFLQTLGNGIKIFEKLVKDKREISGKDAFLLYQSYGFPLEMTIELAREKNIRVDEMGFEKENSKHQELSRTATEGKFKSGLADNSEATTKLHTATHLLNQALRIVLKNQDIHQKGSNITPERLRFDFNFDRKVTNEELKEVETLMNKKIQEKMEVKREEMNLEQAKTSGAQGIFESKYGNKVSVYSIGNFSKEICAGPHVKNTRELGKFRILKEESVAAGIRRIKAFLE